MAIAQVQKKAGTSTTTSVSVTLDSTPTNGNLLVAFVYANLTTVTDITLSGWTVADGVAAGSNGIRAFYKIAASDGTGVTANGTGASEMRLHVFEYSGIATSSPLDKNTTSTSGGSTVNTLDIGPLAETTVGNALLLAGCGWNGNQGTDTWQDSFTGQLTAARISTAAKIVSAVGTYDATVDWTTGRQARGVLLAFKAASVTGTISTSFGAVTAAAVGTRTVTATVSTSFGALTSAASATRTVLGTVSTSFTFTAAAVGARVVTGAISTIFTFAASAVGAPVPPESVIRVSTAQPDATHTTTAPDPSHTTSAPASSFTSKQKGTVR